MINELMKRLSKLPNVTLSDGQEYIQLYDAMETVERALEQEPTDDATLKDIFCMGCEYREQEPCEDCISRQDAIKAIDEKAKRIKNEDTLNGLAGAVGILFDLPPVNPQESKYCDRNICLRNESNGIGCDECEVTKSQEPTDENLHREREQAYMQGYEDASKRFRQEPCEDAISRQVVMNALCDECELFKNGEQTCFTKCEEYHFLATLPPVTPQPKIGHWKFVQRGKYIDICCSNCGYQRVKEYAYNYTVDQISEQDIKDFFSNSNMNFCENCGAKVVEEQESEEV